MIGHGHTLLRRAGRRADLIILHQRGCDQFQLYLCQILPETRSGTLRKWHEEGFHRIRDRNSVHPPLWSEGVRVGKRGRVTVRGVALHGNHSLLSHEDPVQCSSAGRDYSLQACRGSRVQAKSFVDNWRPAPGHRLHPCMTATARPMAIAMVRLAVGPATRDSRRAARTNM